MDSKRGALDELSSTALARQLLSKLAALALSAGRSDLADAFNVGAHAIEVL